MSAIDFTAWATLALALVTAWTAIQARNATRASVRQAKASEVLAEQGVEQTRRLRLPVVLPRSIGVVGIQSGGKSSTKVSIHFENLGAGPALDVVASIESAMESTPPFVYASTRRPVVSPDEPHEFHLEYGDQLPVDVRVVFRFGDLLGTQYITRCRAVGSDLSEITMWRCDDGDHPVERIVGRPSAVQLPPGDQPAS